MKQGEMHKAMEYARKFKQYPNPFKDLNKKKHLNDKWREEVKIQLAIPVNDYKTTIFQ